MTINSTSTSYTGNVGVHFDSCFPTHEASSWNNLSANFWRNVPLESLTSLNRGTSRFLGMVAPFATTSAATVQYARGLFT